MTFQTRSTRLWFFHCLLILTLGRGTGLWQRPRHVVPRPHTTKWNMESFETRNSTISTLPTTKALVVAKCHTRHTLHINPHSITRQVFMDAWTCGVHKTRPISCKTSCHSTQVIVSNAGVWTKHCHKHTIYTRRHHFNTGLLHCRHCNIGYRDTMGTRTILLTSHYIVHNHSFHPQRLEADWLKHRLESRTSIRRCQI